MPRADDGPAAGPALRTVTDGGVETDLIFHHGVELPHFAAFPLLDDERGRALLDGYYAGYAAVAAAAGAGLLLESVTWRAGADWGALLGYGAADLARVNADAITALLALRRSLAGTVDEVAVSGTLGPRTDAYRPGERTDPDTACAYHRPQVEALAGAGAELVTAYTLTDVGEAIGIVRACDETGVPVAISFTVETDGRLVDGTALASAISRVDDAAAPDHYLLNCAHPEHIARALTPGGDWLERIEGLRYNASERSHAELDDAAELDEGDPARLALAHEALLPLLPGVRVLGGCCGTDVRHVAALWQVPDPV